MSRWLSYAETKTPPNHPTNPTLCNPKAENEVPHATTSGQTVGSVGWLGKVSESDVDNQETVVVETIRAGNTRPGPVAIATGYGATVSYQLIDRLVQQGRIQQAKDGSLSIAEEQTSHDRP